MGKSPEKDVQKKSKREGTPEDIYELQIVLQGTDPPIRRLVAVPGAITLDDLHEVIQIVMGWDDEHLHQFTLRDKKLIPTRDEYKKMLEAGDLSGVDRGVVDYVPFTDPMGNPLDMEGEDESAVSLVEVFPSKAPRGRTLVYEYDFGDGWKHQIIVERIAPPEEGCEYPVCLGGEMACPLDNTGGVWGYYTYLDAYEDPNDERHEEALEWLGENYDPEAFDLEKVNAELAKWRRRRERHRRR